MDRQLVVKEEQQVYSRFETFIESRRAKATSVTYRTGIKWLVGGDAEAFLTLAEQDRRRAEFFLIEKIMEKRKQQIAGSSIAVSLAMTKSFLEFYDISLNWKKIKSTAPRSSFVAVDRAPTKEEIRRLLSKAAIREKVAVFVMAASGIRVGAFDYLRKGHFTVLAESGIGKLTVYAGEKEAEYPALLTPEAVGVVQEYLKERETFAHEGLTDNSPFLRNRWNYEAANGPLMKEREIVPRPFSASALQSELFRLWIKAGVRTNEHSGAKRKEFKSAHGFRKFVKTQLSKAGLSWEDQEVLLGHRLSYYRPTLEHLIEEYQKAVPFLTLSEILEVKQEAEKKDAEHESQSTKIRIENLEMKDTIKQNDARLEALEKRFNALVDYVKDPHVQKSLARGAKFDIRAIDLQLLLEEQAQKQNLKPEPR